MTDTNGGSKTMTKNPTAARATTTRVRPRANRRPAAICQVDGARWLTLQGQTRVSGDPARVEEAVRRYAARYRPPRENPNRVVIELQVDRVSGSRSLR